ncbi:hypothetical protein A1O7_02120 [Cladophialophora yegresii CBS 114405]|uniref:JmjC domain-containing protein n=1 Tax=Cladophialophora yegresii CBS 114405 TaxID=1182544 RepID=W9WAX8_9EURO|nr:uncharacterized protein A1O7_02120 [Cladophialophora yegresii CBS 114405]EXJ61691.1 hypothetical protein A1O7_02120 [Cladophialophora yegresii CBS 114405]
MCSRDADFALDELIALIQDYHDFNPDTTVPIYPYPTYLNFGQQVSRGRPCVYQLDRGVLGNPSRRAQIPNGASRGNETDHPAKRHYAPSPNGDRKSAHLEDEQRSILSAPCFRWTKKTLCSLAQGEVEVAVTPDGRADSLYLLPKRCPLEHDASARGIGEISSRGVPSENEHGPLSGHEDVAGQDNSDENDVAEHVFLQPATTGMTISKLIDELCPPESSSLSALSPTTPTKPVYYLQSQDSNLSRPELAPLRGHLPATPPPFALPVLGDPDATNIWIGSAQSVTSTHRDPYENLYLVVKGRKKFVLYPPIEEICLHATMVRTGQWAFDEKTKRFEIIMDTNTEKGMHDGPPEGSIQGAEAGTEAEDGNLSACGPRHSLADDTSTSTSDMDATSPSPPPSPSASSSVPAPAPAPSSSMNPNTAKIPWIPIDPFKPPPPTSTTYPYYKHARPLTVTVEEGQILYLPAGWFHHVTQDCGEWENEDGESAPAPCIAMNYWFDMDYSGEKHVMREMVGRLVERVRRRERSGKR